MSKHEDYEARVEAILQPILDEYGYVLVDVEYVKEVGSWYLRSYIDKEGGITVDDCEIVSRRLSEILDKNDFIEDSYIMEVSSPGLGRPLKKEKDFVRNMGKEVEVRLYQPINKTKEYVGHLKAYDKNTVTLSLDAEEDLILKRSEIALIREYVEF